MKNLKYLIVGIVFGLALTKGEAISWYRIQEMFYFQSFHMYGIFMTATAVGSFSIYLIRKFRIKTVEGEYVEMPVKQYQHGVVIGSLIFGFGWALTGACPGPLYALMGAGYSITVVTFVSAVLGTWVCDRLDSFLPH